MQQRHAVITTGLVFSLIVLCAITVRAEPLAKNGTGTIHSGFKGMGTTTQSGEKRMYWIGAYWGVSFHDEGKGFLHQVAWHCPAITDINNTMMTTKGSCTLTDADGDKFSGEWTGKGPLGGEFAGALTISDGMGKYTGMQGGWEFSCVGVGTDAQLYCRQKYTYKLP